MLTRSPRSKFTTYALLAVGAIAGLIAINSIIQLRSLSQSYGERKTYFSANQDIPKGSRITAEKISTHEMFSADRPKGALDFNPAKHAYFAATDIPENAILTGNTISKKAISNSDTNSLVIFVPTKETIDENISNRADVIAVDPEGFGAETIASNARIFFDFSFGKEQDQNSNPGYFIEVEKDQAEDIAFALSTGDVRLALRPQGS